jgi:hypothetical protein
MRQNDLTPRQAIRKCCIDCVGSASEVRDCQGDKLYRGECLFYRYRLGKGRPSVKRIRAYCHFCMGESSKLIRECSNCICPLFIYRMGKNPHVKGRKLSEEHIVALTAERNRRLNPEKGNVVQEKFTLNG